MDHLRPLLTFSNNNTILLQIYAENCPSRHQLSGFELKVSPENTHRWGVSGFESFDSITSLHTNKNILSLMVKSNLVNLETNHTMILPPSVNVLWSLNHESLLPYTFDLVSRPDMMLSLNLALL